LDTGSYSLRLSFLPPRHEISCETRG
jgi:hypothetical protein